MCAIQRESVSLSHGTPLKLSRYVKMAEKSN